MVDIATNRQRESTAGRFAALRKHNIWTVTVLGLFVVFMGVVAAINYWVDPLHLFHGGSTYVVDRNYQRTMNAGIIRTSPPFDAAVVGSSYVGNFDPNLVHKLFGVSTRVISVFGASQKEISATLSYLLKRRRLKYVFLEASIWNDCNNSNHPFWKFPYGLYRDSAKSEALYLASGSTFLLSMHEFLFDLGKSSSSFSHDIEDVPRWYKQEKSSFDNPKQVMAIFHSQVPHTEKPVILSPKQLEANANDVAGCFFRSILPFAIENPQTRFIVFNPPVLQNLLYERARLGLIQTWNRAQEIISNRLATVKNMRYFDFYAASTVENDCRRFMDIAHFDPATSDQLVRWMHDGRFERTPATNAAITSAVDRNDTKPVPCPPESD